jgi:fumarylacetoacetase
MDALEPYRTPLVREAGDPASVDYLDDEMDKAAGAYDIRCDVFLQTAKHRDCGLIGDRVSSTSFKHQYWSVAQMLAHHTVNGCSVHTGDLMGTGTISGPTRQQTGSMLELTEGGTLPLSLPSTEEIRTYLEDGDAVELRGYCVKEGAARIGFGTCYGMVVPATA